MNKMIDNFRDLRVGDYEEILRISQEAHDLPEGDDAAALPLQARIIGVLAGMTADEVLDLPIAEYSRMSAATDFLLKASGHPERTAASYQCGEFTLAPTLDVRQLTTAQYIDFQTFTGAEGVHIAEVLSVLLIPKGCRYADGYDPIKVQEAIRTDMSAAEALDLLDFFMQLFEVSIASTLTSLREVLKKKEKATEKEKKAASRAEEALLTAGRGSRS